MKPSRSGTAEGTRRKTEAGRIRRGLGRKPRDIFIPDLRIGEGIKVKTRDFR